MDGNVITGFFTLAGLAVGALLQPCIEALRERRVREARRRELLGRALYVMLQTRHLVRLSSRARVEDFSRTFVQQFRSTLSAEGVSMPTEADDFLSDLIVTNLIGILATLSDEEVAVLRNGFEEALFALAESEPSLAYILPGPTDLSRALAAAARYREAVLASPSVLLMDERGLEAMDLGSEVSFTHGLDSFLAALDDGILRVAEEISKDEKARCATLLKPTQENEEEQRREIQMLVKKCVKAMSRRLREHGQPTDIHNAGTASP